MPRSSRRQGVREVCRRSLDHPREAMAGLDSFNRRWPLSACFGAFVLVSARAVLAGDLVAAGVFAALALVILAGLARVLRDG